ncbi:MAG: hypothetical protein GYB33_21010 [Gammaproteobacteria bacterium]|uniref:hypothetical protein n=1 Tax=Pseudomaricurvus alcaniphilus TaxID=1166482 RepID=UPI00140CF1DB|nr:hypothetical protein [Pseudomaricurvus alcaniphilus]MBR9912829.1 hypothetical protein [Gammaproteobacteria bacterium]NHN36114.1 hypothetical protein [Pseudomaricurvus alcaniphilus]
MKLITIICKAAVNPVTEVTELLGQEQINIEDIDFNQFGEEAFLSIAVSDYDRSLALLTGAGFNAVSDDVVLLRGEDRPGELAEIARALTNRGVQIRSLTLMEISSGGAVVAITTSDNAAVREAFSDQVVN